MTESVSGGSDVVAATTGRSTSASACDTSATTVIAGAAVAANKKPAAATTSFTPPAAKHQPKQEEQEEAVTLVLGSPCGVTDQMSPDSATKTNKRPISDISDGTDGTTKKKQVDIGGTIEVVADVSKPCIVAFAAPASSLKKKVALVAPQGQKGMMSFFKKV